MQRDSMQHEKYITWQPRGKRSGRCLPSQHQSGLVLVSRRRCALTPYADAATCLLLTCYLQLLRHATKWWFVSFFFVCASLSYKLKKCSIENPPVCLICFYFLKLSGKFLLKSFVLHPSRSVEEARAFRKIDSKPQHTSRSQGNEGRHRPRPRGVLTCARPRGESTVAPGRLKREFTGKINK